MAEQSDKFQVTIWAFPIVRFLIILSTDRIHQCIGSNRVKEITVGAQPGSRDPFTFPIQGLVLIQPDCFCAAFGTFLFYR